MSLLNVTLPFVAVMFTAPSVSSRFSVTFCPAVKVHVWPFPTWIGEVAVVTMLRPAVSVSGPTGNRANGAIHAP